MRYISLHANDAKWGLIPGINSTVIPNANHNNIVSTPEFINYVSLLWNVFLHVSTMTFKRY